MTYERSARRLGDAGRMLRGRSHTFLPALGYYVPTNTIVKHIG